MRFGALSLLMLGGCQVILGLEDPTPAGDDGTTIDAAPGSDGVRPDASTAPDATPPDALPAGTCMDGATARAIVPPTGGQLVIHEAMADPALVTDANGEWIELIATASIDLNGVVVATSTASVTVDSTDCLRITAGGFALLAHSSAAATNGGLPTVDATFAFALPTSGHLEVRAPDTTVLTFIDWTNAPTGTSMIVDDPKVCPAPAGTPAYNGTDVGTPRATNIGICP